MRDLWPDSTFAAENEARAAAMAVAGTNMAAKLAELQSRGRFTRQEDTTAEMVDWASVAVTAERGGSGQVGVGIIGRWFAGHQSGRRGRARIQSP